MAVFTSRQYGQLNLHRGAKRINWTADTHVVTLHTATYAPDQDVHDFQNDLTSELPTANGYTVGGIALANKTATYDGATNTVKEDADDVVWNPSTLTWRTVVVTDTTPGTAATNPVESYHQGDVDTVSSGGATTLQFNASGIHVFTAS